MRLRQQVIGLLNLFYTEPGALNPDDAQICQALADVATIGLLQERAVLVIKGWSPSSFRPRSTVA